MQTEIDDPVALVRRFNRTVTQRVGALQDRYLAQDRPLGEARVLWEIGPAGSDVRALRARLDLDSGYLSRLLRSLEAAGLVTVEARRGDRRVRAARLTTAGRAERRVLDERSEALAAGMLAPCPPPSGTAWWRPWATSSGCSPPPWSMSNPPTPPTPTPAGAWPPTWPSWTGASPAASTPPAACPSTGTSWCRRPACSWWPGCGASPSAAGPTSASPTGPYLKRMWVAPAARGLGLGRRLLAELEDHARATGAALAQLETNGTLTEAIALYLGRLRRGPAVQRRALRSPLVRQAPLTRGPAGTERPIRGACASPRR